MPKIASANDRAAKEGRISSHRWLGANTAAPLFYGQREQVELTKAFLQNEVLQVDIFALRRDRNGEVVAPLSSGQEIVLEAGQEMTAEVVVSNRNAAHSFPPEVRDLYEAWVEFEAFDAYGKRIFHSGFIQPNSMLDESAHVYKTIILDEQGRPITRHQVWLTNVKAWDNAIPPGRSDVARFQFRLPELQKTSLSLRHSALTLRARVNYRRLNQEYTNYVLGRQKRRMKIPVRLTYKC
jgi:hypothetical protein